MFVDRIKVFAQAGKGGRGSVSFRREKFVPKGGPDGGDGGRGGDVILLADRHVDNLTNLFYEPIIAAKNGGHGMGKKMAGRAGADKIVKVPIGTIVWPADKSERPTSNIQRSTPNPDQSAVRSPQFAIEPIVGVMELPGYRRATIADIPGLIEGAHRGIGLGHEFLRHITRCRILVFVVDVAGSEGRNPIEDLQNLRREIDLYDPILSERSWFAAANKMDLPGADENLLALQKRFSAVDIAPISAATGEGLDAFKTKLEQWLTSASEKDRH